MCQTKIEAQKAVDLRVNGSVERIVFHEYVELSERVYDASVIIYFII